MGRVSSCLACFGASAGERIRKLSNASDMTTKGDDLFLRLSCCFRLLLTYVARKGVPFLFAKICTPPGSCFFFHRAWENNKKTHKTTVVQFLTRFVPRSVIQSLSLVYHALTLHCLRLSRRTTNAPTRTRFRLFKDARRHPGVWCERS